MTTVYVCRPDKHNLFIQFLTRKDAYLFATKFLEKNGYSISEFTLQDGECFAGEKVSILFWIKNMRCFMYDGSEVKNFMDKYCIVSEEEGMEVGFLQEIAKYENKVHRRIN